MRRVTLPILILAASSLAASGADQQLINVRFYHLHSAAKAAAFDSMMRDAAMPVMRDNGATRVGVFKPLEGEEADPNLRISVIAYRSLEELLRLKQAYAQDPDFWPKAKSYLNQDQDDPAFTRIESMLLQAFSGMPELAIPGSADGKRRIFELRTYESHSEIKGLLKVQMFNQGEIQLFEKVGLPAVFYGQAISAANLPQLTYMLVHDDAEAQTSAWAAFLAHPEWESMKNQEQYAETVSKITKTMLVATDYSDIK